MVMLLLPRMLLSLLPRTAVAAAAGYSQQVEHMKIRCYMSNL
jgi:hypothetical protein